MSRIMAALSSVVILLSASSVSGVTWHVPSQCPTIQAGVDSASAGDTVLVACGTYYEHDILIDTPLTLRSETGLASCATIHAQKSGRGIYCDVPGGTLRVEGMTIRRASAGDYYDDGGGIRFSGTALYVVACDLIDNDAGHGGGVYCASGSLTCTGCQFTDNWSISVGGGILCSSVELGECTFSYNSGGLRGGAVYCTSATVSGCTFSVNSAYIVDMPMYEGTGGAISMWNGAVTDCEFLWNTAAWAGGAVECDSITSFTDCRFLENEANARGGAIDAWQKLTLTRCLFYRNGSYEGGALAFAGLGSEVTGCTFIRNQAPLGAGIYCWWTGSPLIENTVIAASLEGAAFYCDEEEECEPVLHCCDLYANSGGDWVGCIADQLGVNGNISADPLFCNPPYGNYGVGPNSPCLPGGNSCGVLIGAFGESCSADQANRVEKETWSGVKRMWR